MRGARFTSIPARKSRGAADTESLEKALSKIERITAEAVIGQVYTGLVKKSR